MSWADALFALSLCVLALFVMRWVFWYVYNYCIMRRPMPTSKLVTLPEDFPSWKGLSSSPLLFLFLSTFLEPRLRSEGRCGLARALLRGGSGLWGPRDGNAAQDAQDALPHPRKDKQLWRQLEPQNVRETILFSLLRPLSLSPSSPLLTR